VAWSGYGVFGVIDSANKTLTVAKCGSGNLHWAGSNGVNLFSTSSADLLQIARKAKIKTGQAINVTRGTVTQFNLASRQPAILSCEAWEGFGETVRDMSWHRSMGLVQEGSAAGYQRGVYKESGKPAAIQSPRSKIDPVVDYKPSNKFRGVTVPRETVNREMFPDWEPTAID